MHKENKERRAHIQPWEYWLGDKAYVGCPEFLTEFKKPKNGNLTAEMIEWNLLVRACCLISRHHCSLTVCVSSKLCGSSSTIVDETSTL